MSETTQEKADRWALLLTEYVPESATDRPLAELAVTTKVGWRGAGCGHQWVSSIASRKAGSNCPYCSNQRVLAGFNDLASINPELAAEWHPTLNGELTPEMVTSKTNRKVFWFRESCGHHWLSSVSHQADGGGCPVCSGRQVLAGVNDLATLFPELASEWHPTKNEYQPTEVTTQANRKVWWVGNECGHEWDALVSNRTRNGAGCPFCTNRKLLVGFNDLSTVAPELAVELHKERNRHSASQVISGSNSKVWWECAQGHQWRTTVANRQRLGHGCPYCAGSKAIEGETDLATTHPDVAARWDALVNEPAVSSVTAGSSTRRAWLCDQGHGYWATPHHQVSGGGCPICQNKQVLVGFNDLATTHPTLAVEWSEKNVLPATAYTAGSTYQAFWQCATGHQWQAYIYNRTAPTKPTECPVCSAMGRASKAETALFEWVRNLGLHARAADRSTVSGIELDIYIPEKRLAIEFNGLYWHGEARGKGRFYHHNKWRACKDAGIQLIQVWEDDWRRNPELVKDMLAHKLALKQNSSRVGARKTVVTGISLAQASEFLNSHHIQGAVTGTHYLALRELVSGGQEIVAVLVTKRRAVTSGTALEIVRYATSVTVPGGFTKLLQYVERTYKPAEVITFSDHCVSDGGLYRQNGFIADKELPPDYQYVVKAERRHKFGYRLKRFKNDPDLLWEEGMTEAELAVLNGLDRIWDAGKTRWVKSSSQFS